MTTYRRHVTLTDREIATVLVALRVFQERQAPDRTRDEIKARIEELTEQAKHPLNLIGETAHEDNIRIHEAVRQDNIAAAIGDLTIELAEYDPREWVESKFYHHFDDHDPLAMSEVDDLCERLNTADVGV